MTQLQGMDIAAVRVLAQQLGTASDRLPQIIREVDGTLERSGWRGSDADQFRDHWRTRARPRLTDAGRRLKQFSTELRKQADQQEQTSNDLGGGLLSGGPMAPMNLTWDDIADTLGDARDELRDLWERAREFGGDVRDFLRDLGEDAEEAWRWLNSPEGPLGDPEGIDHWYKNWAGDVMDWAMSDPSTEWLADWITQEFGFQYVEDGDFYTTNEHSMQSRFGFMDLYDEAGPLLGMDLDTEIVEFESGGRDFRLQLWRGNYANDAAFGGEIGLYVQDPNATGPLRILQDGLGYYHTAQGEDQIRMEQRMYDRETGELLFRNDNRGSTDGDHYWNLAIRTEEGYSKEDLIQEGRLYVPPDMQSDIVAALEEAGLDPQILPDGSVTYRWE